MWSNVVNFRKRGYFFFLRHNVNVLCKDTPNHPQIQIIANIANLPFNYSHGIGGGCLCYIDESIISGVAEKYFTLDFTGKTSPVVAPLIPWGNAWYAPKQAFNSFFCHLNETLCGEKISRVKVMSSTTDLTITVKYPREKGKYDDDIKDLETELGGTLDGHRGETLSYTLKQQGEICERTYIKVKSYMGQKTYLKKTHDIELVIN